MRWLPVCAALVLLGCPPPKPMPDGGAEWRVVLDGLPGTLLSAWESPDGVLYAVGGSSSGALVLRHDGAGWWQMDPGTARTLWWVHGFSASDVYAVGADGVVTHFDGTRWTVEREGGGFTLFGAWGATPDELMAVGGVVTSSQPRAALVTRRAGWAEVPITELPPGRALFKVWGNGVDEPWLVGEGGLVARGRPGALSVQTAPTTQRLTTVHGAGDCVFAVGGLTSPVFLRATGSTWEPVEPPGSPQLLNGVAVRADGELLIVGLSGYLADGPADALVERPPLTRRGLHGAAVTSTGFVAVGGELLTTFGQGVLLARGALEAGPLQPWPQPGVRWDAGVVDAGMDAGSDGGPDDAGSSDAGAEDAGLRDAGPPPDGGWQGPGQSCDGEPMSCEPGLDCWFVFGPFKSFCAALCTDASECGAYGPGACCVVPGPQVMDPVCLPADAGVCDGGR